MKKKPTQNSKYAIKSGVGTKGGGRAEEIEKRQN
jgi:hypothetical protein